MPPQSSSWLARDPNGFGLNHLPYGALDEGVQPQLCVRIGDYALNLHIAAENGLFSGLPETTREACRAPRLNTLLEAGPSAWSALRTRLQELLGDTAASEIRYAVAPCLRPLGEAKLVLPLEVGDYTDFYSSLHHAQRVGEIFRPEAPLLPNYKHIPIGYHGRASSLVVSGTPIRRPWGQSRPTEPGSQPTFAPSAALDFETELAFVVGAGNPLGEPISIADAEQHLFGVMLLNDWSARDLQSWEYEPLGPFLGKSFATSLSPWITPLSALAPYRVPLVARPPGDPTPLPYLGGAAEQFTYDLTVITYLHTGRGETQLAQASLRDLYWSPAQIVAHHTSNGCNLRPGDLLATGTISGPTLESAGCLLERTGNGHTSLQLSQNEQRGWLQDGDEIRIEAFCRQSGLPEIRLASCTGEVAPATNR